jgi:MFS transporter, UMF1 family
MTESVHPTGTNKRVIWAWCLYDWANSAFTTLVVTFIYGTYFTQAFAENEDLGTALWSRGIVVSSLLISILSPILGAMADRGGTRRQSLIVTTLVCVAATTVLTFITPSQPHAVLLALSIFVIANVAFEIGMVFYNSFLPTIATPAQIGRISGYGWGLGYAGGLAALVVGLIGFVGLGGNALLPLSQTENFNVRATNILVAAWFLVFSIPTFLFVRDIQTSTSRLNLRGAFAELVETAKKIRRFRDIVRFLLARLIYNDGLITIFAFGGIYAAGTFGMSFEEVIIFAIAINVAAGLGAALFGFIDDRIGGKVTVIVSLVALVVSATLAVIAPTRAVFWVAGMGIGIFAGPNQAASRSLMGRFVPAKHQAEFYGFYAFSGKATAFSGPFLLGTLSGAFGQRVGVSSVLLFFVVGGVLLLSVNERRGIEAAAAA